MRADNTCPSTPDNTATNSAHVRILHASLLEMLILYCFLHLDTGLSVLRNKTIWVTLICISIDLSNTLHVFIIMLNLFWVVKQNSFVGKYQNFRAAFRLTMRPENKGSFLLRDIGRTDRSPCLSTYVPFYQPVPIIQSITQSVIHISSSMSVTFRETVICLIANIKRHLSLPLMLHA